MLVILIVILILIWVAVVWSIYSNFMVFHSNFSETENYHRAYYSSISALERAELVTKQRQPGYEWSGGFILWTGYWGDPTTDDWWSDKSLSDFSYYWNNEDDTIVFRTIKSKTNRIPATWNWDVEWMLAYEDPGNSGNPENSNNYNMMNYENAEVFLLYNDKSGGNPYKQVSSNLESNSFLEFTKPNEIKWVIRLPKLLSDKFWNMNVDNSLVWNWVLPKNDAIVDWQIRWFYQNYQKPFVIYSTQSVAFWGNEVKIDKEKDSVFRESDINNTLNFEFWNNGWSPFKDGERRENSSSRSASSPSITVIGEGWNDISSVWAFNSILNWYALNWYATQLRFSLLNLLQWSGNNIYPFLEYYVDFWNKKVPDKYFTIDAEWAYKDYKVNMIIKKPTIKESVFWSFTSIF